MDHSASLSAPARRTRRPVLVGLAVLAVAIASFVTQWSLVASAPPMSSPEVAQSSGTQAVLDEADGAAPGAAGVGRSTGGLAVLDEDDGVIPDGVTVSVFDDEVPAVGKLVPDLLSALRRSATDAAADGVGLRVNSGWRSPEYQRRLLQEAVIEYGSQEEAARWVATPETSAHVWGRAVDIGPFDAATWLSKHGAVYGLCQIYVNEPWHFEHRPDAVDEGCPPMYVDPTVDPRMQQ